jgi:hypothetical protein
MVLDILSKNVPFNQVEMLTIIKFILKKREFWFPRILGLVNEDIAKVGYQDLTVSDSVSTIPWERTPPFSGFEKPLP